MIELNELKEGQKVWWGNFEISHTNDRISEIYTPKEFTIRIDSGRIKLMDDDGYEQHWWRWNFRTSSYGQKLGTSLYESKESIMEDWNRKFNETLLNFEKNISLKRKRLIKSLSLQ